MSNSKDYPEGRNATAEIYASSPIVPPTKISFGTQKYLRMRATLAQINAGIILLPALKQVRWRLTDWWMVALGGAATTGTSVNIIGTSAGAAVQLAVTAIAALTRSALVRAGASNAVVLADNGSFVQMDANAPITAINVGTAMTVMTGIDIMINYVADPA